MKIKNLKYLLWAYLLFIFGCGFAIGADDIPTQNSCPSNLPNHSSNNNASNVNTSNWYFNNIQGLIWWYNANPISRYQGRTVTNLINYRINLLQEYYDGPLSVDYADANNIWHLQNAIRSTQGCDSSLHRDCRLGRDTSSAFFNCNVCEAINTSYKEWSAWPSQCPDGFEGEGWCCKPIGTITGPTIEEVSWQGNNLEVDVSYVVSGINNIGVNCGVTEKFEINGGTLSQSANVGSNPKCHLMINTESNEVVLHVNSGVIVGEGKESGPGLATFTKPQDCGSTPKSGDIDCATTYGPSYIDSGTCCTTQCAIPQKTGGGCNTGYIKDGSGCCIQNNCQNPPLTGTDCSNQFGGRGVYSGAIQCCVDSGSCVNPPSSPGQCSGNLVLDQAGQCCITCATPADGSGNCQSGYTVQGSCCFADNMCGDNQINQGGQCTGCVEGETKPNESHTRCICDPDYKCCGVQLNNVVPFIGDCIEMNGESNRDNTTNVTSVTAFPILMQGLMKILMSVIMIFSFLMIIVAGLLIVSGAFGGTGFTTGKKIIKNVIISLILLGCSGLILSLINPSFFK